MLKEKVRRFILDEGLFLEEDLLLVALSGGPDSVALLHIMHDLGYHLEAMHCNFHLRGQESDRDEAFCASLCAELGIKLHKTDFDTLGYAMKYHISIEMAARELRYGFFERIRKERGAGYILTAHHRDDCIETVLLNLVQGTGIKGLRGILPKNGAIIRPLLSIGRQDIMDYLESGHFDYVLDSTNEEDICKRNIIRHRLIPLLEEINPAARENIQRTALNLREAGLVYEDAIEREMQLIEKESGTLSIPDLMRSASPESLLFERLNPLGLSRAQIRDLVSVLQKEGTRTFNSPSHTVIKDRERLIITENSHQTPQKPELETSRMSREDVHELSRDPFHIMIDAEKVKEELELRIVQEGDWMIPLGMKGRKLLSDMMTGKRYSLMDKKRQWVLTSGKDIVWAVGLRIDERYKVSETTKDILSIKATFTPQ